MGLKRFLWRYGTNGLGATIDEIKMIVEKKSIIEASKEMNRELIEDDMPIVSDIYKSGHNDGYGEGYFKGKGDGYEAAESEYEKKLLRQADYFLNQKNDFLKCRKEYEKLLDDYEREIVSLQGINARTEKENALLKELIEKKRFNKAGYWIIDFMTGR